MNKFVKKAAALAIMVACAPTFAWEPPALAGLRIRWRA
jgi:hypothetical protein